MVQEIKLKCNITYAIYLVLKVHNITIRENNIGICT